MPKLLIEPVTRRRVWAGHYLFCFEKYQNLFVSMVVIMLVSANNASSNSCQVEMNVSCIKICSFVVKLLNLSLRLCDDSNFSCQD